MVFLSSTLSQTFSSLQMVKNLGHFDIARTRNLISFHFYTNNIVTASSSGSLVSSVPTLLSNLSTIHVEHIRHWNH